MFKLNQQGGHFSQVAPMHFVGWTPPPMPKCWWSPTCQRLTYQQGLPYLLHLLHLGLKFILIKFHFLFYLNKGIFLIPFLPCMWVVQSIDIRRSVVLLPKTPRTNRWMPRSTQLHLEAICLVQVFTKQPPFGHKRTNAYIHIATLFLSFMNPFVIFHCISMFILH